MTGVFWPVDSAAIGWGRLEPDGNVVAWAGYNEHESIYELGQIGEDRRYAEAKVKIY